MPIRHLLAVSLLTSFAFLGGCAADATDDDTTESDLAGAELTLGHYVLSGSPSPGSYAELVLKSGHRFEAKAYSWTFWERSVADEEASVMSGKFTLTGNQLTLLTTKGNAYGVYAVTKKDGTFAFDVTSDPRHRRKFVMTFEDNGSALDPDAPADDPGTPPAVANGTALRCRSGRHGVNFSISRNGGWMYQLTNGASDHVKLTLDTAHDNSGDWLNLVGSSAKADEDYEVSIPAAAFRRGAKGVTVDVNAGSAVGGVFTAGGVTCDAAD